MGDSAVPLAAIGLVSLILAVVVKPLFTLLKENTRATQSLVAETKKGNKEAKDRNGHLAELVVQQGENTKAIADATASQIITAVQKVEVQEVEHQTVKEVKKG